MLLSVGGGIQALSLRRRAVMSLFALAILTTSWPARGETTLSAPTRWFTFDQGFRGSPGLTFNFVRPVPTFDGDGLPLASGAPRFAARATLASAPVREIVRNTITQNRLLGSGLDHDGVTPLMLLYDLGFGYLDVFTVAGDDLLVAEATGVGRNRTVTSGGPRPDLMLGTVPGKAYAPAAGVVSHGLIVVLCVVWQDVAPPEGNWQPVAEAFVVSQDQGRTWLLAFEDSSASPGENRGEHWAMQNWWPLSRDPHPLEAYFAATDYRWNPGSTGGRAYVFRATRAATGAPWSVEPAAVVLSTADTPGEHYHTAAVLPLGSGGMRVLVSIGDGTPINRIVSLTRTDRAYAAPGWEVREDYHGSKASGSDPGSEGNSFVGCAPGPSAGEAIVGSDLYDDALVLLSPDGASEHPRHTRVHGLRRTPSHQKALTYVVRTPTPERGGPYAAVRDDAAYLHAGDPPNGSRILYSKDGRDWAEVAATMSNLTDTCVHGGHIYSDSAFMLSGATAPVVRYRVPDLWSRRPLIVGPGGFQRNAAAPFAVAEPSGTLTPLTRSPGGAWLDEGVPIDPQPPSAGQVYHLRGSRHDASRALAQIYPCGGCTTVGSLPGTDTVQLRFWIRNNRTAGSAHPEFWLCDGQGNCGIWQWVRLVSTGEWIPLVGAADFPMISGQPPHIQVFSSETETPDDLDVYVALDAVVEGAGVPGYAMPMDPSSPPAGAWYPDEHASIEGAHCGDSWTITLAAQLPEDAWDAEVTSAHEWPLGTIWGDAANFIEVFADTTVRTNQRVLVRVTRDGQVVRTLASTPLFWTRGSEVLIAIADAPDGSGVRATVAAAGNPPEEMIDAAGAPGAGGSMAEQPTEIRFRCAQDEIADGRRVCVAPMLWWGGEIRENTYLDAAQRRENLTCLSFLDGSGGSVDGDGVCETHDNCTSIANPDQSDVDRDGVGDACDDCPLTVDPLQHDLDHDGEGDVCDLDDGLILQSWSSRDTMDWQPDAPYTSWNVYEGDLDVLRNDGVYTQAPGTNALARRLCGLSEPSVHLPDTPAVGKTVFALVTGVVDGVEGSLGQNSNGVLRPLTDPCP